MFSLSGFSLGSVLSKGEWEDLTVNFTPTSSGLKTATLRLITDQGTAFGSTGDSFLFTLQGNAVPEPSTLAIWSLLGAAVGVGAWRRRWKR
jgi:hypothetical protein